MQQVCLCLKCTSCMVMPKCIPCVKTFVNTLLFVGGLCNKTTLTILELLAISRFPSDGFLCRDGLK